MTTDTVIILGCNTGALSVMRSLGRRGLNVIAMTNEPGELGTVSKYVSEVMTCPDPADEVAFVEFLIDNSGRWNRPLIIETGDTFTWALSRNKELLSIHYRVAAPSWDVASTFLDKQKTYELARRNNVPCPWTHVPADVDAMDQVKDEVKFPCILKPINSHAFMDRFGTKVMVVDSMDLLRDRLSVCLNEGHPVMIQEIIPGGDGDFGRVQLLFDTRGEIAAEFHNRKIRQSPPQFGQMRVGCSADVDPDVQRLAYRLFEGVDYRGGFCSVEFRRDARDDSLKLMEVNIRVPRSAQLAISAGVDFPWLLYQDYVHDERTKVTEYFTTTWIELLADVSNVLVRDRSLLLDPVSLLRPYFAKHRVFAVFAPSDIRPFLKQFWVASKVLRREATRKRHLVGAKHGINLEDQGSRGTPPGT